MSKNVRNVIFEKVFMLKFVNREDTLTWGK